ncbi:reverse transcriptase [Gossypium australe]|uniref:Reverse transcriptase n=1 Tax=Gossypium australe TaxID=47621 RepID=A0A5B6VWA1_9ROSI|nr:reverse transcriptase [Gossypium australe]
MAPYEALYGRRSKTPLCWSKLSEKKVIKPELIQEAKIIKSSVDLKQKDIEYVVGDKMFLKVSPWRKIMCFVRKGKLSPRYIRPYKIVERVEPVAYRLALSSELQKIHNAFHVSMLQQYRFDPSHVILVETIEVQTDLKKLVL